MEQLIPNDPAASDTVTEGTVRWLPRNAYAIALGNKPEYSCKVRGVGKNVRHVPGTTHTYYTPTQGQSQHPRHSTQSSQEEINQACTLILEAERTSRAAEIEAALRAQQERHTAEIQSVLEAERKAVEERFAVLWANHEAEFLSHLRHNTLTVASTQNTLSPVIGDTPRQLVRLFVGIISYSLLTFFFFNFFFIIRRCCALP
jgi:hypothetical protein